ncbi:amidohydrolase family protein [Mycolicibacterium sp. CBM1]
MGIDTGVREAVADGPSAGPRLLVAVNMLSQTGGHADFHLPTGIGLGSFIGAYLVDSVDAARIRAREMLRAGVDVSKVASSGGVSSPNNYPTWLGMRRELIAAIVEEASIKIAVGTDAGLSPTRGTNLRGLGLLVKFGGLTPMQAIVADTLTSAPLCGVEGTVRSAEAGKAADLVVVRDNPVDDIDSPGDPAKVLMVVKDGKTVGSRVRFVAA